MWPARTYIADELLWNFFFADVVLHFGFKIKKMWYVHCRWTTVEILSFFANVVVLFHGLKIIWNGGNQKFSTLAFTVEILYKRSSTTTEETDKILAMMCPFL